MSKNTTDQNNQALQLRLPEEIVRWVRVEAVKNDMKYNEFFIQMIIFCKKNGYLDWLKEKA